MNCLVFPSALLIRIPSYPRLESSPDCSTTNLQTFRDCSETQRIRLFGGEEGDEVSLCDPMLGVLYSLFNDLDYVDP